MTRIFDISRVVTAAPDPSPKDDVTTLRDVSASLLRICQRSQFFATLALHARIKITDSLPTAATDGKDIFVNPDFFNGLTRDAQDGLILHEVLHAALLHVPRRGMRDAELWNIAADIVINGMLIRAGYTLPAGGLRDVDKEHLSTEEVFELLARDAKQNKQQPQLGMADLMPGDGSSMAQPDKNAASTKLGKTGMSKAEMEGHWKQALQQAKMVMQSTLAGDIPADLKRELGTVLRSQVDWRSYLWRYLVQTPTDFGAFDRRFVGDGLYLETIAGESVRVHVCVDTSGSINLDEVTLFVGEVQSILQAYPHIRCDLYYADAKLNGPYQLTGDSEIPQPIGGGGTDFRPFFEHLAVNADAHTITLAIYLTDGYGDFPEREPSLPTLWVVTPNGKDIDKFPFGEVIRLLPNE
jgi:predicted metal-dependent peptidase